MKYFLRLLFLLIMTSLISRALCKQYREYFIGKQNHRIHCIDGGICIYAYFFSPPMER